MKELYGNSGYQPQKKERQQTAPAPSGDDMNRKSRKAAQLQSNVLTHADDDFRKERDAGFNTENCARIASGTNAGWSAQTGLQKPINAGKVDAYRLRQNQLNSQVLEQTDYTHFAPMQKKQIDMDNFHHQTDKRTGPANKKRNNELSATGGNWQTTGQTNTANYSQYGRKQNQLQSALDDHGYQAVPKAQPINNEAVPSPVKGKNSNQSAKLQFLSSNIGGNDANQYFHKAQPKGELIDLDLSDLPQHVDEIDVKKAANVKHVISTELAVDNFKGICTGTGRIKIRLNEGETLESVQRSLKKKGFTATVHQEDARKKPTFTGPIYG